MRVGVACATLSGVLITPCSRRPIQKGVGAIERAAGGDPTATIEVNSKDDAGVSKLFRRLLGLRWAQHLDDRLGPGAHVEFLVDVPQVRTHRGHADRHLVGNLLVREALREE